MEVEKKYAEVLAMVKAGVTISKAIAAAKIDRRHFYRAISKDQKNELGHFRTAAQRFCANRSPVLTALAKDLMTLDLDEHDY